jgi:hypothetical protein
MRASDAPAPAAKDNEAKRAIAFPYASVTLITLVLVWQLAV